MHLKKYFTLIFIILMLSLPIQAQTTSNTARTFICQGEMFGEGDIGGFVSVDGTAGIQATVTALAANWNAINAQVQAASTNLRIQQLGNDIQIKLDDLQVRIDVISVNNDDFPPDEYFEIKILLADLQSELAELELLLIQFTVQQLKLIASIRGFGVTLASFLAQFDANLSLNMINDISGTIQVDGFITCDFADLFGKNLKENIFFNQEFRERFRTNLRTRCEGLMQGVDCTEIAGKICTNPTTCAKVFQGLSSNPCNPGPLDPPCVSQICNGIRNEQDQDEPGSEAGQACLNFFLLENAEVMKRLKCVDLTSVGLDNDAAKAEKGACDDTVDRSAEEMRDPIPESVVRDPILDRVDELSDDIFTKNFKENLWFNTEASPLILKELYEAHNQDLGSVEEDLFENADELVRLKCDIPFFAGRISQQEKYACEEAIFRRPIRMLECLEDHPDDIGELKRCLKGDIDPTSTNTFTPPKLTGGAVTNIETSASGTVALITLLLAALAAVFFIARRR